MEKSNPNITVMVTGIDDIGEGNKRGIRRIK